jgi:hypothetical protein
MTATTTTRAFRVWSDRLDSGRLTKAQITQFAGAISRPAMGLDQQGKASALTRDECEALAARIFDNPVLLTEEHTEQGLTWFEAHGRKALDLRPELHDRIVSGFRHFSWRGEIAVLGPYERGSVPIWRIRLNDGTEFAYYFAGWRSTGGWTTGALLEITPEFYR